MTHDRARRGARAVFAAIIAATCGLLSVPVAHAQVDLSGWWRIDQPTTAPGESGARDAGGRHGDHPGVAHRSSGHCNSTTLTGGPPSTSYEYPLSPAADVIDGRRRFTGTPPNLTLLDVDRLLLVRCGCNDGNAVDGDGCGADCQIEPCYTCSGDPSVCTPSPDGAACDDRHDCTTGETCSAGACGGGSAIASCTDLTGTLDVHFASIIDETFTADVVQRNGTFFLGGFVGAVDQTAGTVRLSQPIVDLTFVNCPPGAFNVLAGTAGPVGFSASGTLSAPTAT